MGFPGGRVDLFVVGADFYLGSTRRAGRLKDGWCRFRVLGQKYAKGYFGNSRELGAIWYLAGRVSPRDLRSFEEHKRQDMWLGTQGADVARIIIGDARRTTRKPGALVSDGEFRCGTEEDALSALRRTCLASEAMVICADGVRPTPLLSFLDERYDYQELVLVPPDLEMLDSGARLQFSHEDLEDARLPDCVGDGRTSWISYMQSKNRSVLVARWHARASAELCGFLTRRLTDVPPQEPKRWLRSVLENAGIRERVKQEIRRCLASFPVDDRRLAQDNDCLEFIARKLIATSAEGLLVERAAQASIRSPDYEKRDVEDMPPLPVRQEPPEKVLGQDERGHYEGKRLEAWVDRAQRLFRWIQTVRWVKGDPDLPRNRSQILDDSHLAVHLRYHPALARSRVIPVALSARFSRAGWERAVRLSIVLAEGTTEGQRENAKLKLRHETSLWN